MIGLEPLHPPRHESSERVSAPARETAAVPAPSAPAPAIELRGVHKRYGAVHALRGIDLRVDAGEMVALLGPNGAGKTTMLDIVLGLARPTAGEAAVYGLEPREAVRRGLVSAVLQSGGLLPDLTVAETLSYWSLLFGSSRRPAEVMERAGVSAVAQRRVRALSGGERQRLRFAMALLPDPDLLLLDEPTEGMDVEGRRSFWTAMREDANRGRTVVFATHYLEEADAHADRVVLVRRGKVVADGTAAQVKALAAGRVVRATLPDADEEALRRLPGVTAVERRGSTVVLRCTDSDAVARRLLTETAARDLEIGSVGLEDAFVALTGDGDPPSLAPGGPAADPLLAGGQGR